MTIDYDRNYLANASKALAANYRRMFSEFINLIKSLGEKINIPTPKGS
jgi:hypothetical protein